MICSKQLLFQFYFRCQHPQFKILNRPLTECPLFLYYVLLFIAPFLSLFYTGYPGHSVVFGLASILFTTEHSASNSNCAQIHLNDDSIQGQRRFHWGSQCRYFLVQQGNSLWGIVNWSDVASSFFFWKNYIQKRLPIRTISYRKCVTEKRTLK